MTSRFEPLDRFCGDRRGKKRNQSLCPTIAQSTGGQPRSSARACHVSDELVIRSSSGFELTLRGRKILEELEQLLPKLEGLVAPSVFDPKKERSNFRISGPDNVCMALLPHLCRRYTTESYKVNFASHLASRGDAPGFSAGSTWATPLTNADDDDRMDRILAAAYQMRRSCAAPADDPS